MADIYAPIRAGSDIAFLGGLINYARSRTEPLLPRVRRQLHQRRDDHRRRSYPGHRGPRRRLLRADGRTPATRSTASSAQYDNQTWQYAAHPGRRPGPRRRHRPVRRAGRPIRAAGRQQDPASRRARPTMPLVQSLRQAAAASRPDAAAPPLRLPDPAAALRALHARDGRAGHRLPAGDVPPGRRDAGRPTPARTGPRSICYAVAWTQHTYGVADDRRGGHPPAAAGQHRPPGRRHHGAARPRHHPGQHRYPHALPLDPRLHARPDRAQDRTTRWGLPGPRRCRPATGPTRPSSWSAT